MAEAPSQPPQINTINSPSVGFIGLGLMGVPMCRRLLDAGANLSVWNRHAERCQPLVVLGAQQAESLQALAQQCDLICLCISDTSAVEEVMFGPNGLAQHLRDGQCVMDFSSIDPQATRNFAQQLQTQGVHWIDAPVSGGVAGAEQGTLAIMAGGDAATIDALRPLLGHLGQRVTRMGDVGAGQATKVCNQMLVSCNLLAMAEVLALAEKSGVDATRLPSALQGGFADSIPLQLTGSRMAERELDEMKWHVKTLLKDLALAEKMCGEQGADTPLTQLTQTLMQAHGEAGYLDADPATLIRLYTDQ